MFMVGMSSLWESTVIASMILLLESEISVC